MKKEKRWLKPLRIIQTNLQVTDAVGLDANRLADQVIELGGNALVFNVGGIYAWYPTKVPYHTINPLMETGRDLVGEVVQACRQRDIVFFARYDFSKASDYVYRQHPEWFVRLAGNRPQMVAQDRFGMWDQLVSTCLHGGYQNEAVAFPVLRESMERYHPDGIFVTSMIYAPCQCENCRRIYRERYNSEIPIDPTEYMDGFAEAMMDESVKRYDAIVKSIDPDAAFLHRVMLDDGRTDRAEAFRNTRWWFPKTAEYEVFFEHPIDLVHGETHDGLTGGRGRLSPRYTPGVAMKIANSLSRNMPIDIVHSAPGVGWRHTGLPAAEHRFWLSQVPANRGQVWHSLTSIPDNIPNKEQLRSIRWINERVQQVESWMYQGHSAADVALIWDNVAGHGWAAGLTAARIPFDVILQKQIAEQGISNQYKWVICPEKDSYMESTVEALTRYVEDGGKILLEGRICDGRLRTLAGVVGEQQESEWLSTSYFRMEDQLLKSTDRLEPLVPFSGHVLYSRYDAQTTFLATLIPPFAPEEGAGSPPERAVLPKVDVAWPMVARRGGVVHMACSFHDLLERYGLRSHIQLLDSILDGDRLIHISEIPGIQVSVFAGKNEYMVHLVNGVGERPLQATIPIHDAVLRLTLPKGKALTKAQWIFGGEELPVQHEGNQEIVCLPPIASWEAVLFSVEEV